MESLLLGLWGFLVYSRDHRFRGRESHDMGILFLNYQSGFGGQDRLDTNLSLIGEQGYQPGGGCNGP